MELKQAAIEDKMRQALQRLGVPLEVAWVPDPANTRHGEIKDGVILVYDVDVDVAWQTFIHELLEYKFQEVSRGYRVTINKLIEVIESMVYDRKEKFLGEVSRIFKEVRDA